MQTISNAKVPNFGKNTLYILDIDNTTVQTGKSGVVSNEEKYERELLGLFDDSDVVAFNTGRPKADVDVILSQPLQDRASFLSTRMGTAVWDKDKNNQWRGSTEWSQKMKDSGFDNMGIRGVFSDFIKLFRQETKDTIPIKEYNEPYSVCTVLWSDSPAVYDDFAQKVESNLEALGHKGFQIGAMAEKNVSAVMVTPKGTSKGVASDFMLSRVLQQNPSIDRVVVAGDSRGDLANFLIDVPRQIRDTAFAFVNPKDKSFFAAVYDGRKLHLPQSVEKSLEVPFGYYSDSKLYVPKDAFPAPKGLIETIRCFRSKI